MFNMKLFVTLFKFGIRIREIATGEIFSRLPVVFVPWWGTDTRADAVLFRFLLISYYTDEYMVVIFFFKADKMYESM